MPFHFSDRQGFPTWLLLGGEGFISLVPMPQLQQTVITKETYIILLMLNDTINAEQQQLTSGYTQNRVTHKVQLYTLYISH